jgi:hypothetical protein
VKKWRSGLPARRFTLSHPNRKALAVTFLLCCRTELLSSLHHSGHAQHTGNSCRLQNHACGKTVLFTLAAHAPSGNSTAGWRWCSDCTRAVIRRWLPRRFAGAGCTGRCRVRHGNKRAQTQSAGFGGAERNGSIAELRPGDDSRIRCWRTGIAAP